MFLLGSYTAGLGSKWCAQCCKICCSRLLPYKGPAYTGSAPGWQPATTPSPQRVVPCACRVNLTYSRSWKY